VNTRSAIVVVVDRFGAGFLGPYGNTWIDTPGLNRLASESLLLEFAVSDTPDLERVYRSYWQGAHAMCPDAAAARGCLPSLLSAAGVDTTLLTDDSRVAEHPLADEFASRIVLPVRKPKKPAKDVEQTQMARSFAAAIEWIRQRTEPFCLWFHARGMDGPWDAPLEFRNHFADEDDPEPPTFVAPPALRLEDSHDPDALLGIVHAYAGQVVLLDMCVAALLDALHESPLAEQTMLVLTSPRGFPLGEHRRVGAADEALYGELLHVPLLVRLPDQATAMQRSHALVQPPDLYPTLRDWFELSDVGGAPEGAVSLLPLARGDELPRRDCVCSIAGQQRSIRTPAWFLRQEEEGGRELFLKPDDRWEVNEISNRREDVVEPLVQALDQFQEAAQSGKLAELPPLAEVLREGSE
jgi:arylsulfatase A-like enzyme